MNWLAWYELKDFIKKNIDGNETIHWAYFHVILSKMSEIENKYVCQSLKEAGY